MRILVITRNLKSGGSQRAAKVRAIGFRDAGHETSVLAFEGGGEREKEIREAGLELFLGGDPGPDRDAAVDQAVAWRPDIVHVHRPGSAHPPSGEVLRRIKAALGKGLPVIECNHFARVDYTPDRELIDVHLQLSEWCQWKFERWASDVRPRPISVVSPHVIESKNFYPEGEDVRNAFRDEQGIPRDAFVFGRFGSPLYTKWSGVIFPAFAEVAAKHPNVWLMLVGLAPEFLPHVERLPANVRRRVVLPDFLYGDTRLRAGYAAMDVFLHAADIGESFGQVLGESMLCEVPVITLAKPLKDNSQVEVVGHRVGGLVVHNRVAMVQAMEELLGDPELLRRLGRQGNASVRERFDTPQLIARLLRISEHAMQTPDREALRKRIADDSTLISHVRWERVRQLLEEGYGTPSLRDRIGLHVLHDPRVYRVWRRLKH